ncbi:hypothetical protein CoNPh17_CDS0240 [Staphylococcus phage S-CoN_Ph17]|nr:hypothetical protein CoNPh17_CDS0240 [Staphylococcus phage S-CoN_Ph17]
MSIIDTIIYHTLSLYKNNRNHLNILFSLFLVKVHNSIDSIRNYYTRISSFSAIFINNMFFLNF